ncbi:succinate dehydrogenase cytochrome b560 subunit, mitochondrial-like [Argonauta hians]
MSLLLRSVARQQCLFQRPFALSTNLRIPASMASTSERSYEDMKYFWEKNQKLQRPMSPHLTIYKPQLTSILSVAHRATGIVLSAGMTGLAVAVLALPHEFPYYVDMVKQMNLNPALIIAAKYAVIFPMMYHTFNGLRHLAWDWATGFKLNTLYKTGYLVVGLSVVFTATIVHLL